jgi:hypothetical protein
METSIRYSIGAEKSAVVVFSAKGRSLYGDPFVLCDQVLDHYKYLNMVLNRQFDRLAHYANYCVSPFLICLILPVQTATTLVYGQAVLSLFHCTYCPTNLPSSNVVLLFASTVLALHLLLFLFMQTNVHLLSFLTFHSTSHSAVTRPARCLRIVRRGA